MNNHKAGCICVECESQLHREVAAILREHDERLIAEAANADAMIAHRWFAEQFGEIMNGRDFAVKIPMATQELVGMKQQLAHLRAQIEGFVELYGEVPLKGSMIAPGRKLWREYYQQSGKHMILTDEGWEPGETKQSYLDEVGTSAIYDEVNTPEGNETGTEGVSVDSGASEAQFKAHSQEERGH